MGTDLTEALLARGSSFNFSESLHISNTGQCNFPKPSTAQRGLFHHLVKGSKQKIKCLNIKACALKDIVTMNWRPIKDKLSGPSNLFSAFNLQLR